MKYRSLLWLLLASGCTQLMPVRDRAVHHLLSPIAPDRPMKANAPAIAVHRAALPAYLDTEQLVSRSENGLMVSDIDLWAESINDGISRVIAVNLSRLTGSINIQPVQRFTTLDYTHLLELRISQFENNGAGEMVLSGVWKLQHVSGEEYAKNAFHILVPLPQHSSDSKNHINAMNEALLRLAREIMARTHGLILL